MIKEEIIHKAYQEKGLPKFLWKDTPYEIYERAASKTKGAYGEAIVANFIATTYNLKVKNRINSDHDRIVKDIKTEIKFSCATERNYNYEFMFNHIGFKKDWERIIFCGINGDLNEKIVWFTKEDMEQIKQEGLLSPQQGGKTGGNDDWMSTNKNTIKLLNHFLAKQMEDF